MNQERLAELEAANADGKLWSGEIVGELLEYIRELKHNLHGAGQCIDAYMTAFAREEAANGRLTAEADRLRDAWQSAWAERNEARSAVAAVRGLAEKWAGEPMTIEAFLANEILKLAGEAADRSATDD